MPNVPMTQLLSETFPPKPKWEPTRDVPDLTGKVVIVTGGNTGIGKETVKQLLLKNAKVYMASRSRARAEEAIAELKAETGKEALFLQLNLANLASVTKAAEEFKSKEPALHILFNSAGVMYPPIESLTEDGYDLQFGTNLLGPSHLTLLLIDQLEAGAKSSPDGKARVVHTSSSAAYGVNTIRFDTLKGDSAARNKLGILELYYQSKFANATFSNLMATRFADRGITSNAVNPGNLKTELTRHMSRPLSILIGLILYPAPMGAYTQLYVGTSPETSDDSGEWFVPWARRGTIGKEVSDPKVSSELWDWIEEQRRPYL